MRMSDGSSYVCSADLGQGDKARRKAAKQVRDAAAELLALYAQRAAREGYRFKLSAGDYQAFAEGFGFEETVDQAAAIEAVIGDMTSGRPMDRDRKSTRLNSSH